MPRKRVCSADDIRSSFTFVETGWRGVESLRPVVMRDFRSACVHPPSLYTHGKKYNYCRQKFTVYVGSLLLLSEVIVYHAATAQSSRARARARATILTQFSNKETRRRRPTREFRKYLPNNSGFVLASRCASEISPFLYDTTFPR